MKIDFELKGSINAKSIDDAINTLEMMKMDYDIYNIRLHVEGNEFDEKAERQVYRENLSTEKLKQLLDECAPVGDAYNEILEEYNKRIGKIKRRMILDIVISQMLRALTREPIVILWAHNRPYSFVQINPSVGIAESPTTVEQHRPDADFIQPVRYFKLNVCHFRPSILLPQGHQF